MSDEGEDNRTLFRIGVALNVLMLLVIIVLFLT